MKCPECVKEGDKSIVRSRICFKTGSNNGCCFEEAFYDEEGNSIMFVEIYYNPNIASREYTCFNGHWWREAS